MAATHPGYNIIKMPGTGGIITVAGDTKYAVRALKRAYKAAAASCPGTSGPPGSPEAAPAKKKLLFSQD